MVIVGRLFAIWIAAGMKKWILRYKLLAKEAVHCNGRENITRALNSTTITQDHNRSISFIFARHHICVAAYPLLTLAGNGLGVHTKQNKNVFEYG